MSTRKKSLVKPSTNQFILEAKRTKILRRKDKEISKVLVVK